MVTHACTDHANWDLGCHLRRHCITGFGQNGPDMLLTDAGFVQGLRSLVRQTIARRPGGDWEPEDALLDISWVPAIRAIPHWDWVRHKLAIPRCTNTISVYIMFLLDITVQVLIQIALRRLLVWRFGSVKPEHEKWVFLIVFVSTLVCTTIVFEILNRFFPFIEKPHTIMKVLLSLWFYAASNRVSIQQAVEDSYQKTVKTVVDSAGAARPPAS